MSAKKKRKGDKQGVNFAITLVTLSVIFVFVGYLIGQYAVKALQQQYQTSTPLAQQGAVTPVTTTPKAPPSAPVRTESPPQAPAPSASQEVTPEPAPSSALYRVQVGVFSERANAERMVAQLKEAGYEGLIISGPPHRVQTGAFSSQENAERLLDELRQKGFEAIIVR
ncbi:MAG: hypothetical protein GX971_12325 [Firmicutes bacterium]|nr:hypothetical protein [Bacillota bacterium]